MRLKDCYSRTMTFATEYLTKFGFGYSHFLGKEPILIEILIKSKPQLGAYIQLAKLFEHSLAPAATGPANTMLQKKTLDLLHNPFALGHELVTQPHASPDL